MVFPRLLAVSQGACAKKTRTLWTHMSATTALSALCVLSPAFAQVATTCPSGMPGTRVFTGNGSVQTFTVPANVSQIRVIAVGADGGVRVPKTCGGTNFNGGAGARIEGTYAVTQGQVFTVIPGSPGANGDCEAGGGGATGVYITGNLAIIAGAGGGDDNTGNGGGGQAGQNGGNGGNPAGNTCPQGGLGGIGGNGGQEGEVGVNCSNGNGGAGGGGFLTKGNDQTNALGAAHTPPKGGARCSVSGAAGGAAGTEAGAAGAAGGWGACGGGGADDREGGGGGGYSGGGGGPESAYPGGGGSVVQSAGAATVTASTTIAGADGGGTGQPGSVRLCWPGADLSITKTDFKTSAPSGSLTTYSIVVKNSGPSSANGAIVTDPVATGLSCTTAPTCSATGGAVCPASPTVAQLQSGLLIPTFPNGGQITLQLACTVL